MTLSQSRCQMSPQAHSPLFWPGLTSIRCRVAKNWNVNSNCNREWKLFYFKWRYTEMNALPLHPVIIKDEKDDKRHLLARDKGTDRWAVPTCCRSLEEVSFQPFSSWPLFTQLKLGVLVDLLMSANYLDIRQLIKISSKIIANMIVDKTPEQIRKTFYIEDDLTAELKGQIVQENSVVKKCTQWILLIGNFSKLIQIKFKNPDQGVYDVLSFDIHQYRSASLLFVRSWKEDKILIKIPILNCFTNFWHLVSLSLLIKDLTRPNLEDQCIRKLASLATYHYGSNALSILT